MVIRSWVKAHLPYPLVLAIARAINRPWMEDLHRTERLTEYTWVLGEVARYHQDGDRILDFGYAGGYFDEMLCQFGQVTGIDPRETPPIKHPNFHREWPWAQPLGLYGTIVSISTLEHLPTARMWVEVMLSALKPGGQLLITIPCGAEPQQFKGYRLWSLRELLFWPNLTEFTIYRREQDYWQRLDGEFCELAEGVEASHRAISEHLPESTEHQVNGLACLRFVQPLHPAVPSPTDADDD